MAAVNPSPPSYDQTMVIQTQGGYHNALTTQQQGDVVTAAPVVFASQQETEVKSQTSCCSICGITVCLILICVLIVLGVLAGIGYGIYEAVTSAADAVNSLNG
ncbi:uncharacterized protein LOC143449144 [Clavelina lepadiformis]|uniref:Uncharacterized protein n=1 Tax=Clavelina lepadiformis TaxID=159417 RepID=A0ABP0GGE4_CLALP